MKSRIIKNQFLERAFRTHVRVSEDIFGRGRINILKLLEQEFLAKTESENIIEVQEIPVLRNGHTMKWILGDHKEGEEICLTCDQCGWVSLPIHIFKEYFHYSSFRANLPEDERALMSARMHLTEVMGGKVRSYCPHCKKHLIAVLDTRKEERQPEQG